ncbi:MAG: hypothetical protein IT458_09110 [Planctomycetes bacterium]|nr:hypothetical protein [Planctomycetota bacterium]
MHASRVPPRRRVVCALLLGLAALAGCATKTLLFEGWHTRTTVWRTGTTHPGASLRAAGSIVGSGTDALPYSWVGIEAPESLVPELGAAGTREPAAGPSWLVLHGDRRLSAVHALLRGGLGPARPRVAVVVEKQQRGPPYSAGLYLEGSLPRTAIGVAADAADVAARLPGLPDHQGAWLGTAGYCVAADLFRTGHWVHWISARPTGDVSHSLLAAVDAHGKVVAPEEVDAILASAAQPGGLERLDNVTLVGVVRDSAGAAPDRVLVRGSALLLARARVREDEDLLHWSLSASARVRLTTRLYAPLDDPATVLEVPDLQVHVVETHRRTQVTSDIPIWLRIVGLPIVIAVDVIAEYFGFYAADDEPEWWQEPRRDR